MFEIPPMNAVAVIFVHTLKLFIFLIKQQVKLFIFLIKQQVKRTNQNSEFISSIIPYEEKPELIGAVYKVFISNSIFFLANILKNCTETYSCLAKY